MPLVAPKIEVDITAKADKAIQETDKFIRKMNEAKKTFIEQQKALDAQDRASQRAMTGQITDLASAISLAKQGYEILKQAYEFSAEGAQLQRLEDSFESLASTAGTSGDKILEALQKASRGTVANSDLILSANRAMMLGLGADAEKLGELLEVAAFRGRAMGLSTTQAFNDIVTGVGRASPMILDNLGIVIDSKRIYSEYAESIGKSEKELTKQEKTQALLNAVIEEGNKQMADAGGLVDDTATSYERLNAATKNLVDTSKKATAEALEPFVRMATANIEFVAGFGEAFEKAKRGEQSLADFAAQIVSRSLPTTQELANASKEAGNGIASLGDAATGAGDDLDGLEEKEKALEQATKQLSSAYKGVLSAMFTIQSSNDKFAETMDGLIQKDSDLADQKKRLTLEWWATQAAGDATSAAYSRYAEKIIELTEAEDENAAAKVKLVEDQKKAAQQRVFDLTRERLAADGLIDSGEYEFLQNLAVQRGLVSRAAADQAIAESKQADDLIANFAKTQPVMKNTLDTMQSIAALNGTIVQFGVNFSTMGFLPATTEAPLVGGSGGGIFRDSGGYGDAGMPYLIGTGAQPEMFIPDTPGTFIPNADKLGPTINISVGAINNRADIDYLAQEVARRVAKV